MQYFVIAIFNFNVKVTIN